jgi:hypothetical protein
MPMVGFYFTLEPWYMLFSLFLFLHLGALKMHSYFKLISKAQKQKKKKKREEKKNHFFPLAIEVKKSPISADPYYNTKC